MISNILSSAVSGLSVNAQRVGIAAENIANVTTNGYQPKRVESQSLLTGGAQIVSRPQNAPQIDPDELSRVDIGQEFSTLILAENAYNASLKAVEAADEMSHTLLDESV